MLQEIKKLLEDNTKKKLNLGCGKDYKEGFINLDINPKFKPDLIYDLNQFPYPFKDNIFDYILCKSVIEHLPNTIKVMEELYRIAKDGCLIHFFAPYANSVANWNESTHVKNVGFGFFRNLEHCKFYTKECRFVIVYQRSYPTKFGKFIPEIKISKNLNLRELLSTFIGNLTEEIECVMKVLKD